MGAYHPNVVHFAIALVFVGVAFRLLALTRKVPFAGPTATTLVVLGTLACFVAVYSGDAAHGPVERIPGVRPAVVEHEEWGVRTRNLFVVISLLEIGALLLAWRQHPRAYSLSVAAAIAGAVGLVGMYETAAHGGERVYGYGGGVGTRSGQPEDVNRLFVTGVYQQALQDRENGKNEEAMALIDMAAARVPANVELQLLAAEWTNDVKKDPAAALRRLDAMQIPADDTRNRIRAGLARVSALLAQGNRDGARAVVQTLKAELPDNAQVNRRLAELDAPQP